MERLKKAGHFLCSMRCGIILLIILAVACTVGSFIPQGETAVYYMTNYPEAVAGAIALFQLDDIFHCWWFVGLTLFLCVNLLCCSILRFPVLLRRMKEQFRLENCLSSMERSGEESAYVEIGADPEKLFRSMGFFHIESHQKEGVQYLYGVKNKIGIWGSWLCHAGLVIIIAGFGLGQMMQANYTVYGVAGQEKMIGDTGYSLRIDDFEVLLREDETVEQYRSALTITDPEGKQISGETSVNHPFSAEGMKFYQNSTGWAADLEVWKDGEVIQRELLCAGEHALIEDMEGLALMFHAFYPDCIRGEDGMPQTASAALKNPGYLYTLYYHEKVLGMNVLTGDDQITVEGYTLVFKNPRQYTLIQIKRDPFTWLAAVGGLLVMASLILAFYMAPEELWACQREDGVWLFSGRSRKAGAWFMEELIRKSKAEGAKKDGK